MKKSQYLPFEKFVLRTPLLPLDFFKDLTSAEIVSDQQLIDICQNETIREAIFSISFSFFAN